MTQTYNRAKPQRCLSIKKKKEAMPGHKVCLQGGGEVRDGLKCTYCRLVLKDPIQTSDTGRRYCQECFKDAARFVAMRVSECVKYFIRHSNTTNNVKQPWH